jgi:hypothetical protein
MGIDLLLGHELFVAHSLFLVRPEAVDDGGVE